MMAQGTSWLSSVSMAFAQTRHAWKAVNNPVASAPPLPATTYMPMSWPGWERWETEYGNGRQNGMDEQRIKLALTSSWVFANVNAVANEASLATLQVVERQRGEQEDKEIVNHDLEVLWEQPNPFMGRSYLMKFWIFNLLLSGRAALFWVPGQGGLAECWPVPSLMLTPIAHPTEFITGYWFQAQPTDKPLKIDRKYITWSRLVHPFDLRDGLSPLAAIFEAIEADLFMRRWNKAFFGKENAAPTGLISVPKDMLDPDIARVRQEMAEFFGGAGNRRVAIARAGDLEWKPFDRSQKDMQFLKGREFSRDEIDRAFGFPEGYWSDTASRANAESAVARMIENAVWPHLVMLSEDMNAQTVPVWYGAQYRAMFEDIRPRNRALEMQEMQAAQATLTIDEIRKKYWKLASIGDERGALLVAEVGKGGDAPPVSPNATEMPPAELPEAPEPDDGMPPEGGEQPTDADQLAPVPDALDVKALDLDRWQTKALKALKAGKSPNVRFAPEALDDADADAIRAALMDARTPAEVRAVFAGFSAVKHGSHDQSTHGRRTGRRAASLAGYRHARAAGATPAEARAFAKRVSDYHRMQSELAYLNRKIDDAQSYEEEIALSDRKKALINQMITTRSGDRNVSNIATQFDEDEPRIRQSARSRRIQQSDLTDQSGRAPDIIGSADRAAMSFVSPTMPADAQKVKIASELGFRTDIDAYAAGLAVKAWASTSNDTTNKSLQLQAAAARTMPTSALSPWQRERIKAVKAKGDTSSAFDGMTIPGKTTDQTADSFIRNMHAHTQEEFAKAGITHVTLHRGVQLSREEAAKLGITTASRGQSFKVRGNALESWSADPGVASNFSGGQVAVTMSMRVPVSRIVGTAKTGFGCLEEAEFVVSGGRIVDEVIITGVRAS